MIGSEIYNDSLVKLSLVYVREYEKNPANFIGCFKKFKSIRSACEEIVKTYKRLGAYEGCLKTGKDFSEWANKQETEGKEILAEILLIIYSIVKV